MKSIFCFTRRRLALVLVMALLVTSFVSLNLIYGNMNGVAYASSSQSTTSAPLPPKPSAASDSDDTTVGDGPTFASPTEPQTVSVRSGEKAVLNVIVPGATGYYWFIDRGDGKGFVTIEGANSATYITSEVSSGCDGYRYYCCAYNENGGSLSPFFTLNVY